MGKGQANDLPGERFLAKMYHFSCTLVSQKVNYFPEPFPPPPLGTAQMYQQK